MKQDNQMIRKVARAWRVAIAMSMLAGTLAAGGAAYAAKPEANLARTEGNPLGVVMVRFKKGVGKADMVAAITAAGGAVVNDLSRIGRMAVDPQGSRASTILARDARVSAVWMDKVSATIPRRDIDAADANATSMGTPQFGSPGPDPLPDPWHNALSFWGETNFEGILQWDDARMNVPAAWSTSTGNGVVVAVLDTGVQGSHKELQQNYDNQNSANTIPCNLLTRQFGPGLGERDCSSEDTEGHGTWVAGRILGAVNGFASNGVAPNAKVIGYKVLSTNLGGGLTSWIVDGMIRACDAGADLINMSLGGWDDPVSDAEDYLTWVDATNYCLGKGTAVMASAGNDHVRINRVNMTIGGVSLVGVGRADSGPEGIGTVIPGAPLSGTDRRGLVETPAGVPGVIMVSATSNGNGALPAGYTLRDGIQKPTVGARDQLAYYSNYGARIDIAAPGGARKLGLPRYDGGPADILYGGWGTLGPLSASGEICSDPALASRLTFACFKVSGSAFGWLQGTSMSAPNATGVAALTLSAKPGLRRDPAGLLARLQATARTNMTNLTGPNDPNNTTQNYAGTATCATGFCHLTYGRNLIRYADAYGAGIVNAAAAVAP